MTPKGVTLAELCLADVQVLTFEIETPAAKPRDLPHSGEMRSKTPLPVARRTTLCGQRRPSAKRAKAGPGKKPDEAAQQPRANAAASDDAEQIDQWRLPGRHRQLAPLPSPRPRRREALPPPLPPATHGEHRDPPLPGDRLQACAAGRRHSRNCSAGRRGVATQPARAACAHRSRYAAPGRNGGIPPIGSAVPRPRPPASGRPRLERWKRWSVRTECATLRTVPDDLSVTETSPLKSFLQVLRGAPTPNHRLM